MLRSLISRITFVGLVIAVALAILVSLLLSSSLEMSKSFRWVSHSQEVIETMDEILGELRDAESGQRGFLLTRDNRFVISFDHRVEQVALRVKRLEELTRDNPVQNARAITLRGLVEQRIARLRKPLNLGRAGKFEDAIRIVSDGHGRELMGDVDHQTALMMELERNLLAERARAADIRLSWNKWLVMVGGPVIATLIAFLVTFCTMGIRRPAAKIQDAMEDLGDGNSARRLQINMGSSEFNRLARGYNGMADRLESALLKQRESDEGLQAANNALLARQSELQARGSVIELLGGMAHRLQAARTDKELSEIISCFLPQVLPGIPGALYTHNNSRNRLVRIAVWGSLKADLDGFAPNECWALRLGHSHFVLEHGSDIVCPHVRDPDALYHCEPLLAGGEVIGLLYLEGAIEPETQFRLAALAENIASALVNHRLQRDLREQTIRDPLTGLFNRRYMEETLQLEIARTARSNGPLALVMCDVDHFKRFNDEFGHDAGDAVLRAVAAEIGNHFRDGDVACRFGGEEFSIIAPGATPQVLEARVERLRIAISELNVRHGTAALGALSMSFGIAGYSASDRDGSMLVKAADAALYRAKREGRNRLIIAEALAA